MPSRRARSRTFGFRWRIGLRMVFVASVDSRASVAQIVRLSGKLSSSTKAQIHPADAAPYVLQRNCWQPFTNIDHDRLPHVLLNRWARFVLSLIQIIPSGGGEGG